MNVVQFGNIKCIENEMEIIIPSQTIIIVSLVAFFRYRLLLVQGIGGDYFFILFHQKNKTNSEAPKICKANLKIKRILDEVAIALVFDRSGSMASGRKETVVPQTAAIVYEPLCSTPKTQIYLLGFNDVPVIIKGRHPLPLITILQRIPLALKAKGGTDFPFALKVAVNLIEKFAVHKKIIFTLTDGDITGFDDPIELVNKALIKNIEVFVIAVDGSDYSELINQFGKTKVIKIDHISDLPLQIKKLAIASLKNQND